MRKKDRQLDVWVNFQKSESKSPRFSFFSNYPLWHPKRHGKISGASGSSFEKKQSKPIGIPSFSVTLMTFFSFSAFWVFSYWQNSSNSVTAKSK
jgi:hypothetical protein